MGARVVYLVDQWLPAGDARWITALARSLPEELRPVVIVLQRGAEQTALTDPLEVHSLGLRGKWDLPGWAQLYELLRRLQPRIVHAWHPWGSHWGLAAALKAGATHLVRSERSRKRLQGPAARLSALAGQGHLARLVVPDSQLATAAEHAGWAREIVRVLPDGVALAGTAGEGSQAALCAQLGMVPCESLMLVPAPLEIAGRLTDLLWASTVVQIVRESLGVIVFGNGTQRDAIARYAHLVDLAGRFAIVDQPPLFPQLLAAATAAVAPGNGEGERYPLLEAQAAGVPVIATDLPGHRELVVPEQTGLLYPPGHRGALGRAMRRLIDEPDLRSRLGSNAQAHVEHNWPLSRALQSYTDLYAELL